MSEGGIYLAFLNKEGLEHLWAQILMKLRGKVDKEEGKGLSTNDFTNEEKEKLAALGSGVMANVDWNIADESLPGAIKNKPFGYVPTAIIDVEYAFKEPADGANVLLGYFSPNDFVNGQVYDVYLDNELLWQSIEWPFNDATADGTISISDNQIVISGKSEEETHSIKIIDNNSFSIKKLDPEWLDAPTLPDASNVEVDGFALVVKDGEWVISDIPVADKSDIYSLNGRMDLVEGRVDELETSLSDIDAALDAILAIQEELISGGLITFTIDGVTYQAEKGMTWNDWVGSIYDTKPHIWYNNMVVYYNDGIYKWVYSSDLSHAMTPTMEIEKGHAYIYD